MARSGRVHGDLMVDVVPANAKLRHRAAGIVAEIAGVEQAQAEDALRRCDDDARAAVLLLVAGLDADAARRRAAAHRSLREALEE
jgi:N-acetylmuramic acid 6-phosphate etherase